MFQTAADELQKFVEQHAKVMELAGEMMSQAEQLVLRVQDEITDLSKRPESPDLQLRISALQQIGQACGQFNSTVLGACWNGSINVRAVRMQQSAVRNRELSGKLYRGRERKDTLVLAETVEASRPDRHNGGNGKGS